MQLTNCVCVCTLWYMYTHMYMHILDKGGAATVTFAACGLLLILEATQREKMASIEIKNRKVI